MDTVQAGKFGKVKLDFRNEFCPQKKYQIDDQLQDKDPFLFGLNSLDQGFLYFHRKEKYRLILVKVIETKKSLIHGKEFNYNGRSRKLRQGSR